MGVDLRNWRLPVLVGALATAGIYLVAVRSPAEPSQQEAVAEIIQFVEKERGLTFSRRPPVRFVDDATFVLRLTEANADVSNRGARMGELMQAVGLLDPGTDVVALMTRLGASEAVGSYDIRTGDLLVRGAKVTPYRRMVLAHELTHALDDQRFELHRPRLIGAFDGSAWAFMTLFEGNARRVELAYRAAMSPAERRAADAERAESAAATDYSALPPAVVAMTGTPYLRGPKLVQAILDHGGQAALDRAFMNPPATVQQALHPDLYLSGAAPMPVAAPPSPRPPLVRDVFGALFLELILAADRKTSEWAARAWGGDRVVTWASGAGFCAAIAFAVREHGDVRRFEAALRRWSDDRPHGTVRSTASMVTVTSCSMN